MLWGRKANPSLSLIASKTRMTSLVFHPHLSYLPIFFVLSLHLLLHFLLFKIPCKNKSQSVEMGYNHSTEAIATSGNSNNTDCKNCTDCNDCNDCTGIPHCLDHSNWTEILYLHHFPFTTLINFFCGRLFEVPKLYRLQRLRRMQ